MIYFYLEHSTLFLNTTQTTIDTKSCLDELSAKKAKLQLPDGLKAPEGSSPPGGELLHPPCVYLPKWI